MGAPPVVRYVVSGNAASGCLPTTRYDTIQVTILDIPLPIELENFAANYNGTTRQVDLTWSTTSETNNRWFLCEKSLNGDDWVCIDTIHSKGNSNTTQLYNSNDVYPSPLAYYRLIQEDWDGNRHIYDPVSVYAQDKETVSCHIYPNPNEGDFYIQFNQEVEGVLYLTDGSGKLCYTTYINSMCQEIQTNDLAPGTYFVEVRLERFFYGTKIIIQ
jgi:hypothetical protein